MDILYSSIASLAVAILAFLLQQKIKQIKELQDKNKKLEEQEENAIKEGLVALLRVSLIEAHSKYTKRESISTNGFQNWKLMFDAYIKLGGNGMVKTMNKEIEQLPIKND